MNWGDDGIEEVKIKKKYENTVNNIEVDDFKPYIKKGGPGKKPKKQQNPFGNMIDGDEVVEKPQEKEEVPR